MPGQRSFNLKQSLFKFTILCVPHCQWSLAGLQCRSASEQRRRRVNFSSNSKRNQTVKASQIKMERLFGVEATKVEYSSPRFRVADSSVFLNYSKQLEEWKQSNPDVAVRDVEVLNRAAPVQNVFDDDDDTSSDDGDVDIEGEDAPPPEKSRQSMWSGLLAKHTTFAAAGGESGSEDIGEDNDDAESGSSGA
jgi:hypothetical protein